MRGWRNTDWEKEDKKSYKFDMENPRANKI
jgi:hypothetical protein